MSELEKLNRAVVGTLAVIGFVSIGGIAVQIFRSYQETQAPETSSGEILQGPGYTIQRSILGENILEITGYNLFPFQEPLNSIARGKERLERLCGDSVIVSNPGYQAVPETKAYATVPNSSDCSPRG